MKLIVPTLIISILLSCDMKSSDEYHKEANLLEQQGKYKEAIALLDKTIKKDPKNIKALLDRGVDYALIHKYNEAIQDYSKVIAIDSTNCLAYFNRANNKKRKNDILGAISDYNKAISTKGKGELYFEKTENPMIDNGFEYDVLMEEILFERGIALYKIDSLKGAFKDFNFAIKKNYEVGTSLYWRGVIYLSINMKTEGCNDLFNAQSLGDTNSLELIKNYCK